MRIPLCLSTFSFKKFFNKEPGFRRNSRAQQQPLFENTYQPLYFPPLFFPLVILIAPMLNGPNVKMKIRILDPPESIPFSRGTNGIVNPWVLFAAAFGSKANPAIWLDGKRRCSTNLQGIFFTFCWRFAKLFLPVLRGVFTTLRNVGGEERGNDCNGFCEGERILNNFLFDYFEQGLNRV